MLSHNASTYKSAASELEKLINSDRTSESLSMLETWWKFIPKRAPWHGGFWERLIDLTKAAVKKALGKAFVIPTILQTLIVEIEAVLNDRPLTYVLSDLSNPEPLTLLHLLCGRCIISLITI